MGLGVLADRHMDHTPGTTRYFDDPEKPQVATSESRGLKCTKDPEPIILVPQPSDDLNDPLVGYRTPLNILIMMLSIAELANMETRQDTDYSLHHFCLRYEPGTNTGSRYSETFLRVFANIYRHCLVNGILPFGRWGCWHIYHSNRSNLGQEAYVYYWDCDHNILERMGWSIKKLWLFAGCQAVSRLGNSTF